MDKWEKLSGNVVWTLEEGGERAVREHNMEVIVEKNNAESRGEGFQRSYYR